MKLICDKPANPGVENVLKRARQLCEARWTPIRPLPSALFGVKGMVFPTEEEQETGRFALPPATEPGRYTVIALAKNEYGVYTSPYCEITVE